MMKPLISSECYRGSHISNVLALEGEGLFLKGSSFISWLKPSFYNIQFSFRKVIHPNVACEGRQKALRWRIKDYLETLLNVF